MAEFHCEIERRFGLLPNFFLTFSSPLIAERVWHIACLAYLDNPLPSLFKERLLVWLSRFGRSRYCLGRHAGYLLGLGHPSGDRTAVAQPVDDVRGLLSRSLPRGGEIILHQERCASHAQPLADLPASGSELERSIFACTAYILLRVPGADRCQAALGRALGPERLEQLLMLVAWARAERFWTGARPDLLLEDDMARLLDGNDELRELLDRAQTGTMPTDADWVAGLSEKEKHALLDQDLRELERRYERELADSRLLHEISIELIGTQDVATLYGKIVDAAARLMGSSCACMHMRRRLPDGRCEFELLGHRGFPGEAVTLWKHLPVVRANGWTNVLACGGRVMVTDVEDCGFLTDAADLRMYRHIGIRSLHATPLCTRAGSLVGAIIVYWRDEHAAVPREIQLLDILARQAADLIERAEAVEAQRVSEARFRGALRPQNVGIVFFNVDGRITEANDAFMRMSGYGREELAQGRIRWTDLTPDEWMPDSLQAIAQFKQLGFTVPYEKQYLRKDGSRWWGLFAATSLSEREGVEYVIDVTARKQAEQALMEADRRKDEFLATLAHELRNPLAPISNAVQLLRNPNGRRKADRLVDIVERQVHQIVRLVDDLLEVSRITCGKIELNKGAVRLADVVRDAIETSRPLVEQGRHLLDVCLPDGPVVLEADAVRLTQVLANLLNNAAKYTDPGGRIMLDARRDQHGVSISVRDSGVGIEPEQLPHVFDLFVQGHSAAGRGGGGLGIGLTMARKLVEMHGGSVTAYSAGAGLGSEFVVRLPLPAHPKDQPADPPPLPDALLAGQRILVVDDNRDAADSLGMLLELDGALVQVVYDGRSALAAARARRPDAVLLDLGMPGMDGYEVARQLRADEALQGLRIVALTGWGQQADRERTRAAGFDHHLTKPVDIQALVQWLARR
jgi:PAS domain S-box-containing protein